MISNFGNILVWGIVVLFCALFSDYFVGRNQGQNIAQVTMTDINVYAMNGQLEYVEVQDGMITGQIRDGNTKRIVRTYVGEHADTLIHNLTQQLIQVNVVKPSWSNYLFNLLIGLVPIIIFLLIQYWTYLSFSRSGSGGIFGIDKTIAKSPEQPVKTTFADIAGADEAKEEFAEIIAFLKDSHKFTRIGARLPKGILLVGPPGCGKTLFSRATAGEAGCAFFYVSASEFVEMFVGLGAKRVRDVFRAAKKLNKPCIVFIDEIDAIGKKRSSGAYGSGNDERESTLNQLLVEMDGFDQDDRIIILGATNRPEILDEALKRAGRFDRVIALELPDRRARTDILKLLTKKFICSEDIDWVELAETTEGFSGADIATMVNEAGIFAAMENRSIINQLDLERARDKIMIGPEKKSLVVTEEEKKLTAYHEAGHAIVAWKTGVMDKIVKVTIRAAGRSLGRTAFIQGDHVHKTKKMIWSYILISCGGRCAEKIVFGDLGVTTGASSDFASANRLAREMVASYMSNLGVIALPSADSSYGLSSETYHKIEEEIKSLIERAIIETSEIINNNKNLLDVLAESLLIRETLDWSEVEKILESGEAIKDLPEQKPKIPSYALPA